MRINITKKDLPALNELKAALSEIGKKRVLVGIPEASVSNPDKEITNAKKLYENTVGNPAKNVPPRPLLEPAIEYHIDKLTEKMKAAALKALEGKSSYNNELELVGALGLQYVIGWFDHPANGWEANSPMTIKAKGSSQPMIDTGAMKQSLTYVISGK